MEIPTSEFTNIFFARAKIQITLSMSQKVISRANINVSIRIANLDLSNQVAVNPLPLVLFIVGENCQSLPTKHAQFSIFDFSQSWLASISRFSNFENSGVIQSITFLLGDLKINASTFFLCRITLLSCLIIFDLFSVGIVFYRLLMTIIPFCTTIYRGMRFFKVGEKFSLNWMHVQAAHLIRKQVFRILFRNMIGVKSQGLLHFSISRQKIIILLNNSS